MRSLSRSIIVYGIILIATVIQTVAASPQPLTIALSRSNTAVQVYRVVLHCHSEESRARGLQGFRGLRRDEAALFEFDSPGEVVFWMGTVSYPIDIAFVGADGRVRQVYQACMPGSEELYPSLGPVKWVIETAAGSGIKAGDSAQIVYERAAVQSQ